MMRIGTSAFVAAVVCHLWAVSGASWWAFAAYFAAGTILNHWQEKRGRA